MATVVLTHRPDINAMEYRVESALIDEIRRLKADLSAEHVTEMRRRQELAIRRSRKVAK